MKNVAGSDAKWLDVSAERFPGWVSSFARRHGEPGALRMSLADGLAVFTAADGTVAECHPPFAESFAWPAHLRPFAGQAPGDYGGSSPRETPEGYGGSSPRGTAAPPPEDAGPAGPAEAAEAVAAHAQAPRAVGVLLVRLGGYAAGVFTGYPPALADAKVGSRLVHGRSAAGGWSQQRFARRRRKQANEALEAAADTAVAVFGRWESGITASSAPAPDRARGVTGRGGVTRTRSEGEKTAAAARGRRLDVVVLGGDRRAMAGLRDDPRLAPYFALATERFLTVPDPKRAVLEGTPRLFTAVRIRLLLSPGGTTPRTPRCPPAQA